MNSTTLHRELAARINTPELRQRILAHLRIRSGHHGDLADLDAFQNNGCTEQDKVTLYSECLRAILTGAMNMLQVTVPTEPPVAVVTPEVAKAFGMDKLPEKLVRIAGRPKVTLNPAGLRKPIAFVLGIIPGKTSLPILSMVRCVTNGSTRFSATDLDCTLAASVGDVAQVAGELLLPKSALAAAVKGSKETMIIELGAKLIASITADGLKQSVPTLDVVEFPQETPYTPTHTCRVAAGAFKHALSQVEHAQSTDQTRYVLNSTLFEIRPDRFTLAATDGRRLHLTEIPRLDPDAAWLERIRLAEKALHDAAFALSATPKDKALQKARAQAQEALTAASAPVQLIVPSRTVTHIMRLPIDPKKNANDILEVTTADPKPKMTVRFGPYEIMSKVIEGNYPNYRQVIPAEHKQRVLVLADELARAVSHADTVCTEKCNSIKLTFTRNKITVTGNSPEKGQASSEIAVNYKGNDLGIAFYPHYLLPMCTAHKGGEITCDLIDELSPGVFTQGQTQIVIMPMRLS